MFRFRVLMLLSLTAAGAAGTGAAGAAGATGAAGAAGAADQQAILTDPNINYEFQLKAPDGTCFDPFATPAAFVACQPIQYPNPATAGHYFTFLDPVPTGDGYLVQLKSQKTTGCLTISDNAFSIQPCLTPAPIAQTLALHVTAQTAGGLATLAQAGNCLAKAADGSAQLSPCDGTAAQTLALTLKHDNLCVHTDDGGKAELSALPPEPWADDVTLIWGDCLNKGILFRSAGFDPNGTIRPRAVALATTGAEASVMTTDQADRIFWGDLSGHVFVYSLRQGTATILDQYGPLHGTPQLGAGRPHFFAFLTLNGQASLIVKDLGNWLIRAVDAPPAPEGSSQLSLLPAADPNEPVDGELHHGIVNGMTPRVDREDNLFGLGDQQFQQRVWLNRLNAAGQWHHRFLATIGTATTHCSDMTYNAFTDAFYALCTDGMWKLQIVRSGPARDDLHDLDLSVSQLMTAAEIAGETPKAAQVLGPDERVFIYDEGTRSILQRVKSGDRYLPGPDLFSGVINNIWETTVFFRPTH